VFIEELTNVIACHFLFLGDVSYLIGHEKAKKGGPKKLWTGMINDPHQVSVLDKYFAAFDATERLTGKAIRYVIVKKGVLVGTANKVGINTLRLFPGSCYFKD
jgi:hypothetical protein